MLIEQIIEFELRAPKPLGRITPKTCYFYDKRKISDANIQMNYYSQLKISQEAIYFFTRLYQATYKI